MRNAIYVLVFLSWFSCVRHKSTSGKINNDTSTLVDKSEKTKKIQYTDQQLEKFLDSVGNLSTSTLMEKVAFKSDSIFKNQQQFGKTISTTDFAKLKQAFKEGEIDLTTAKNIFGNFSIDSVFLKTGSIPITYFSFDKNKNMFNEFAICLGPSQAVWSSSLYFFKKNILLSKHIINHRYGLELEHYTDIDGKTVIYYKENYQSGSGIWWYNFHFYKYDTDKLIPILNELQNSNLRYPWRFRVLWFESSVVKTNPLTLKMVYYQELPDTSNTNAIRFVDDSTFVSYAWDEKSKTLRGNYENSKITKSQILTYYLEDNELLFINAYYKILKNSLLDKNKKPLTLRYINQVKNHFDNR
jgi:hypothetical protein